MSSAADPTLEAVPSGSGIALDLGGNRMPFMHPFHGDDFYFYSPASLRRLLINVELIACKNPLWVFTLVGAL